MKEIVHSGLAAQKARQLTDERKEAWATLRDAEKRLMLDLLFWQDDPSVFGEAAAADELPDVRPPPPPPPPLPDPDLIAQAVGPLEAPPAEPVSAEGASPLAAGLWQLAEEALRPLSDPGPFPQEEA
jgi:hypothetical protein